MAAVDKSAPIKTLPSILLSTFTPKQQVEDFFLMATSYRNKTAAQTRKKEEKIKTESE